MCFKKNRIIRTEYVHGSGGHRSMFFRKEGTDVVQRRGDCGYREGESLIIVQWDGSPEFDSGYHARYFPATMAGLKAAHTAMDELQ
jgi:hypothetical protein